MKIKTIPILGLAMACMLLLAQPAAAADPGVPEPAGSKPDQQPLDKQAVDEWLARQEKLFALYYPDAELVEAATRSPKPISQVAENVTIITAEEIEAMNAHTVGEVLNRVPGVFIASSQDFGGEANISIQGSDYEHVLVLMDGVRWNNLNNDFPDTTSIPVQIIKRIEVIKGPASSTWGSSLGGVINIITKDPGKTGPPSALVSASFGEAQSQDYRGEVSGSNGRLGYYLFAGRQKSDGLENDRFFDNKNFYAKAQLPLSGQTRLSFSTGYSEPERRQRRNLEILDEDDLLSKRVRFATVSLDTQLTRELSFNLATYLHEEDLEQPSYGVGGAYDTNYGVPAGGLLWKYNNSSEKKGATSRLGWNLGKHAIVLGAEIERRQENDVNLTGPAWGAPLREDVLPTQYEETWATYANATIQVQKLAITPGVRYDYFSISKAMTSPSLGATYQLGPQTLLRLQTGKGFRKSPLFKLAADPSEPTEEIWSHQAGLETAALPYLHLKTTLFHHVADRIWDPVDRQWTAQKGRRTGGELEVETTAFHGFSLAANYAYCWSDFDNKAHHKDDYLYTANIFFRYNNPLIAKAEIFGHFIRWDENNSPLSWNGRFDDMIWTLNISREIAATANLRPELFFTAHNLFGGSQYWDETVKNPGLWLEAGLMIHFN